MAEGSDPYDTGQDGPLEITVEQWLGAKSVEMKDFCSSS